MSKFAVVNVSTTKVVNVVDWDGGNTWRPPAGCIAVNIDGQPSVTIGWSYVNGVFSPPS